MHIMVVGASQGLGKAFIEGLCRDGDTVIGISRRRPVEVSPKASVTLKWIEADLSSPTVSTQLIADQAPNQLDVLIYNVGLWEHDAFEPSYRFLATDVGEVQNLIDVNITSAILLLRLLLPRLLQSTRAQIILTGSTSGLPQSGTAAVTFAASKFALRGIADALRECFREEKLAVTCLQIGDLNTNDSIHTPIQEACKRGQGELIPMHDVVTLTRSMLDLSPNSYVKEITMPAICDSRF